MNTGFIIQRVLHTQHLSAIHHADKFRAFNCTHTEARARTHIHNDYAICHTHTTCKVKISKRKVCLCIRSSMLERI